MDKIILCTIDEETGRELAEKYGCKLYTDYEEMFNSETIDFAAICLPTPLHYPASISAMNHSVNVLCEKPFAAAPDEASEMLRLSEEKGLLFMIAHCLRFTKLYTYLKRCVEDGRFGKLLTFHISRDGGVPRWSVGNWFADTKISGGVVRDFHIHATDIIVGLLGMPKSVYTVGNATNCRTIYGYDGITVSGSASWRDIEGISFDECIDAVFEHAWFKSRDGKASVYYNGESFDPFENNDELAHVGEDKYEDEITYYLDCLTNGTKPEICLPSDSLRTLTVSFAESESMEKKAIIEL